MLPNVSRKPVLDRVLGVILLAMAAFLALPALAQTTVSGNIGANTRWTVAGAPYVVSGNVSVENNAVLTIDPGVTVFMGAGTSLTVVAGSIQAAGTTANRIRVLSDKTRQGGVALPGDWKNWVFTAGTRDTRLDNVDFEHGSGLQVRGSAPVFNNLAVRNHLGAAISVDLTASPSGVGNEATGNTLNGIEVPSGEINSNVRWGMHGIPYVVSNGSLSVGSAPAITSLIPDTLQQGESGTVNVSGNRLAGLSRVDFDAAGATVEILPGASDTAATFSISIAESVPLGPIGANFVTDAGVVQVPAALTIARKEPKLSTLSPASVFVKQAETVIDITGKNLLPTSSAELDGISLATEFVSNTVVRAIIPSQQVAAVRSLRVRTPDPAAPGTELLSNSLPFSIVTPPAITLRAATEYGPPSVNVSEFTISQSPETEVGDYLVLVVYRRSAVTVPPGFSVLAEISNPSNWQWITVYGKLAEIKGAADHRLLFGASSTRLGASLLTLRTNGINPTLYGPWKKLVPAQASVHSVPAASSPVDGLAIAVNHEGYAYTGGASTSLYANSPYVPARRLSFAENRFNVATRDVRTGMSLAGSVTADHNTDGGDMVFVLGW